MQQALRRFTGFCGIFALGFLLASYVLTLNAGVSIQTLLQHLPDVLFPSFAEQLGRPVIFALWSLVISNLFLVGFSTGIERLYASRHWNILVSARLLTAAMVILMIVSLFSIGILKGLAPVLLDADLITNTMRGTGKTFIAFRNYTAVFGGFLVAMVSIGLGLSFFRTSKILGYGGITAGVIGLVGAFWPLLEWLGYLRNLGYLLFLIWTSFAGVRLLRGTLFPHLAEEG